MFDATTLSHSAQYFFQITTNSFLSLLFDNFSVLDLCLVSDFEDQAQMIGLYERVSMAFSRGGRDGEDDESWLVNSPREGYERVAKGNYAFMWDDAILQWITVPLISYLSEYFPAVSYLTEAMLPKLSGKPSDL